MIYIFPLETYARELPWRVHFACYLLQSSPESTVFILETTKAIQIACLMGESCTYIGKHIYNIAASGKDSTWFNRLHQAGCRIIFVEEEGGVFLTGNVEVDKDLWRKRAPYDEIRSDLFDTMHWGQYQYDLTCNMYGPLRQFIGGAPSIDSCIISHNACITTSTPHEKDFSIAVMSKGGLGSFFRNSVEYYSSVLSELQKGYFNEQIRIYVTDELNMFSETLELLQLFRSSHFEFRPHPSLAEFFRIDNDKICISDSTNTPINSFLKGKSLLIHDGCTTAIQAHYMGIRTISISPFGGRLLNDYVPASERKLTYESIMKDHSKRASDDKIGYNIFPLGADSLTSMLFANKPGELVAFDALASLALTTKKSLTLKSTRAHVRTASHLISFYSRLYDYRLKMSNKVSSKFSRFSIKDVKSLIDEWSLSRFSSTIPNVRCLGSLGVRLSLN